MNPKQGTIQKPLNAIATLTAIEADSTTQQLPDRLHLLRVGNFNTDKYGLIDLTAADCSEMVSNFDKGLGRPGAGTLGLPVNFRHDKAGVAAAWINGLEFDGKDLWGTGIKWSRAGQEAVVNQEYACLSSEFTPRCLGGMWVDPENTGVSATNVFTGAGLTNIPMFTGNRPVMASATSDDAAENDRQVIYINAKAKEQSMHNLELLRVKASADLTADERTFIEAHAAELSDAEKGKFGIKVEASTAAPAAPKTVDASAVKGNEGVVQVDAAQLKSMNDRLASVEADNQTRKHEKAESQVDAAIAAGKIVADKKDHWVKLIEADATNAELLEGLSVNASVAGGEKGKTGGDANASTSAAAELKTAIEAAQKENDKLSYTQAQGQVLAANADLAKRIEDERAGNVN